MIGKCIFFVNAGFFCEFAESCLEHFGWEKSTNFGQPNINRVAKFNWVLDKTDV